MSPRILEKNMRKTFALAALLALPLGAQYLRGVNISGAEFGQNLPGVEGTDYTFNSPQTYQYFAANGLMLVRLPIQWERMQPALSGPLDANYLAGVKREIGYARQYGMSVVIEIQNFGRYSVDQGGWYQECVIDNFDCAVRVTTPDLADFWVRMSNEFAGDSTVYAYDLMNEPHDMGMADWKSISQTVLNAVRNNADNKLIMIPGDSWSGALNWVNVHGPWGWIVDPANNFAYEAHFYFDADGSGEYKQGFDDGVWDRAMWGANSFAGWCQQNGARCYVGEYGIPDNDLRWMDVLDSVLSVFDNAGIDGTYWSAGEWWGPYSLSVQPLNNFSVDRPQMTVLWNHLGPQVMAAANHRAPAVPALATPVSGHAQLISRKKSWLRNRKPGTVR
jgi:endoglucanase